jgi:NTP pyrophosphatase (non-canonical NTP hydrolase)
MQSRTSVIYSYFYYTQAMNYSTFSTSIKERKNMRQHVISDWTIADWGNGMAGECGEACNYIKKIRRGDNINLEDVGKELADVISYAELTAQVLEVDLAVTLVDKYNEISKRFNHNLTLSLDADGNITFAAMMRAVTKRRKLQEDTIGHWVISDYSNGMAGECGEACNLIKKMRRGDDIDPQEIGKELADVIMYVLFIANELSIDITEAVRQKFNEISDRMQVDIKL